MADDGGQPGEDLDLDAGAQGAREQDGGRSLEHVEEARRGARAAGPRARMTLAPPVRPLPIVRGSGPPARRATMTPHGIPPIR